MSAMSNYLEVEIRKHIFRTGSFTKPTVLAICLCTADPTDAGTGAAMNEVANANGYARQDVPPLDANWSGASATDGLTDNVAEIAFPQASGGNWGTITHFAIVDNVTFGSGNMLIHGALTVSKVVNDGDQFKFAIGDLNVTHA